MSQPVTMIRDAKAFPDSHDAIVELEAVAEFEAMGWSRADKEAKKPAKGKAKADAANGLSHAEICADLEALGVEFDPRDTADDLLVIRDVARAERDAKSAA